MTSIKIKMKMTSKIKNEDDLSKTEKVKTTSEELKKLIVDQR